MGRSVILGNGSLTVGLNELGLVNDFYYPYVGLDNLTNARIINHKIGIWVDDVFSWVDDKTWNINVNFRNDALISVIEMTNDRLNITLKFEDFVDSDLNIFGRHISILNKANSRREVRLFMHQVFQISKGGRGDTGLFEPDENYILDYKGRCSLLIFGQDDKNQVFDQFAIGNYAIEGKEGTYMDAEDGTLSDSPVEHGGVDSVIRFSRELDASAEMIVDYWIVAADSQYTCEKIHAIILKDGLLGRLNATKKNWSDWLNIGSRTINQLNEQERIATNKSLMVIKAHIDRRGGIIASCDSSIYNYGRDYYSYVWPRDGAYAIWPLIRLGYKDEAKKFFYFCRDILTPEGYLMHKYQPDRAIGSTWHPLLHGRHKELAIQEDETAIVVFMLGEYYKYSKDDDFIISIYDTLLKPACDFMTNFIDTQTQLPHASYDLWEEKFLTSTYTTAVVYRSLLSAVVFAEKFEYPDDIVNWSGAANKILKSLTVFFNSEKNYLRKGFLLQPDESISFDDTLDISSLYGAMIFDFPIDSSQIEKSVIAVENKLLDKSPSGGTPRYENDNYFASNPPFLGNPWFITTLWMAQYYIRNNQTKKAEDYVNWVNSLSYPSGVLAEQINPTTGESISVAPIVWSHAELINTILDINQVKRKMLSAS